MSLANHDVYDGSNRVREKEASVSRFRRLAWYLGFLQWIAAGPWRADWPEYSARSVPNQERLLGQRELAPIRSALPQAFGRSRLLMMWRHQGIVVIQRSLRSVVRVLPTPQGYLRTYRGRVRRRSRPLLGRCRPLAFSRVLCTALPAGGVLRPSVVGRYLQCPKCLSSRVRHRLCVRVRSRSGCVVSARCSGDRERSFQAPAPLIDHE